MKFKKRLAFSVFILLFLSWGEVFANTCYDPHYGYYECNPAYSSYPDQGQTFVEGAVLGLFLGGFVNGGGYGNSGHWGEGHGHGGYGGHGGGGGGHGGHHH